MLKLMIGILKENDLERRPYVEPFAGGCGLALSLLYRGHVSEIFVNDVDPAIWSFWHCVLERTEEFVEAIQGAELAIPEWRRQREIYLENNVSDPLKLGFSAFYLNRTNRSGIIKGAGAIGGFAQNGNYKIDCRFNRDDLSHRIRRVAKYKKQITLSCLDALEFIKVADKRLPKKSLFCVDPPYFNKGSSLYTSFYKADDHSELSSTIQQLNRPWLVTYDDTSEIRLLYQQRPKYSFDVNYSVQTKRVANELLIASHGLSMPLEIEDRKLAS